MLHVCITIDIGFYCINDTVVSYTTFNNVITIPRPLSFSAVNNEIKPFFIVSIKSLYLAVLWQIKPVCIHYCLFCSPDGLDTDCPFGGLVKQWCEIEAWTEIQVFSANAYQRMFNNDIRAMV